MSRDARAYLWDVLSAAEAIDRFVAGVDAEAYARSEVIHSAVERKFEIIGEALSQLAKRNAVLATAIPFLAQVVAFRNQLIHGYASVNSATVWNVIQDSLPALLEKVESLLDATGEA